MTSGETIIEHLDRFHTTQIANSGMQKDSQLTVVKYLSQVLKPIWDKYPDLDAVLVRAVPTRKKFTRPVTPCPSHAFETWRCLRANVTRQVSDAMFALCPGWQVVKQGDSE